MRKMKGFTLIELLVVISIIGILVALSLFGLEGTRRASRDAKRKTDLELVRSGLEIYKSDCGVYPNDSQIIWGDTLVGLPPPVACSAANTYISQIPKDPTSPKRDYKYAKLSANKYVLCAFLEQTPTGLADPLLSNCPSCGTDGACNYLVKNP